MNRCSIHRVLRAARVGVTWSAGLFALALLVAFTAPALAAPVLDGNIDDVVAQANTYIQNGTGCGIVINDPAKDICLSDPLIVPCTNNLSTCLAAGQYYVNGFDQILAVAAVQGTDAWWGIRVNGGQIGDSDGDGTDGQGSNCPPPGLGQNPEDGPGIAEGERYIWRLDTNCDGVTDVRITVQGGAGTHQPTVFITQGDGVTPIPGASGQAMYGTSDLEVHTTGLQLPPVFSMNTFVGSDFDGMSEDAAGPAKCNTPLVSLSIQKTVQNPTICPGDKDRFTVTVTNTSTVPMAVNVRDILPAGWTYADNISGDFAFASQNGQVVSFGPLTMAGGAVKTVSFDATSPSDCLGPYENKAVADGAFTSPCLTEPSTALTDTARATVTCQSKPCVNNVSCQAPGTACNGDQITLKGFATNCGDRAEDIVITLNGHDHILNNVAAGGQAEFDTTFTFSCTPSQTTQWSVSAVGKNSCGTSAPGTSSCSTLCKTPPCVNAVSCSVPASACDGDQILLKGFATNCGDRTEQIVITLSGPNGVIGSHAFNPAAGAVAEFDTTITFHCTGGQTTNFSASAVARNDCGVTQPVASAAPCSIVCKTPPCVNNVSCSVPASACSNSQITLKGFATNCGDRTEEIVITLSGPGGVIGSHAFNEPAGGVAEFDTLITLSCTPGAGTTYTASATARNDCGVSAAVVSNGCTVQCLAGPCVNNVTCSTSASSLCDGSQLKLTGNAHNCSDRAEQIVITLLGPGGTLASRAFNVAAGASVSYDTTFTFNCTGSETKTYSASAVATNDCGVSAAVASSGCPVTCAPQPCVDQVSCATSASALCDGSSLKLTGNAHNCSGAPEQIVLTLLGPGNAVLASRAFNVAAGASVSYDTTFTFHCTGTETKTYTVSAVATNSCGTTPPANSSGCPVTCKTPPCVSNVSCAAPSSACSGDRVTIKGFATNCGDRAGEIVITLSGPGGVIGSHAFNEPAGGVAEFDTTITFNCTPGLASTFTASAIARNDCGTTQAQTSTGCSIQCKTPPCATVTCSAPASGTSGTPIQISAIGHNCGDRNEDLYVCLLRNGAQVGCHWLRDVPPGGDARFDTTVTFTCTGTEIVTYSATVSAVNDCGQSNTVSSESTCPVQCIQVGGSCPRTVGYWGAQCAQKGNGSTKYTVAQLTQIATCIDARVQIFNWSDKFAGFCAVINPDRPMDCKKQALRQFAGLLANACVGELGIKDATGDSVHLSLNDPNPCTAAFPNAKTLGDLIDAIDAQLVQLQNSNAGTQAWCAASDCADGINNGRGIPLDPRCSESGTSTTAPSRLTGGELSTDGTSLGVNGSSAQVLELYRPTPNPFTNTTSFAYQVSGSAAQRVQIGIYDVAGRLIRELVNDTKAPGQYQTVWNGQDQGGATVVHGVYFIRAYVGGVRVGEANRILYLR